MKQLANKFIRYLRLYYYLFKFSLMSLIIYRLNGLMMGMTSIVWMFMMIVFATVVFGGVNQIAGWTFWEIMLLLGIHELIFLGTWMFFAGNLGRFIYDVRQGSFDKTLLKPVNQRFLVSFNSVNFTSLGSLVNVIVVLSISLAHVSIRTNVWGISLFFVSLISAYFIIYLVYFCVSTLSLFFVNAETFLDWLLEMTDFDRYPAEIYNDFFRFFLFFVLPILFFAYVPTAILLNKLPRYYAGLSVLITIWLYFISTILWRAGLKKYQSASS